MSDGSMQLLEQLRRQSVDSPGRLALREVETSRTMNYEQLREAVDHFSRGLRNCMPDGEVVIIRLPNRIDFHVAFLAALQAGLTAFPVPTQLVPNELEAAAAASAAAGIVDAKLSCQPLSSELSENPSGPALLLQSSGTTGMPKIARRSAESLDAVAANCVEAVGIESDDQMLACVPLCHSYGLEHGLLAPIFAGATVHLASGFDIGVVQHELAHSGITIFPAVPSIFEMLSNLPAATAQSETLRLTYSAGGALPNSVFARFVDHYGLRIGQIYGATEIGSITFAHPSSPFFSPVCAGTPMRGVEVKFDGESQLLVRSPSMMGGYLGENGNAFTGDGFFPTGDLARVDSHGNLHITGRLKLLIDVGGLKVNPLEVEETISAHPSVGACVVVPMRLSETVYRLKALVTPRHGNVSLDVEALRQFAKQRLSTHKVPRVIEIRATLPRSATGKVLRHLLVESA